MLLTHVQTCDDTLLSKCYGMDCFGTNLTHVQTCDDIRARSALQLTAAVHTWHMPKPVMTFVSKSVYGMDCIGTYFTHVQSCDVIVLKVLRSGLLRYILHTCPKLWRNPCSKCYGVDCFGILHTCPKLRCNPCSKCYGMDCFGTYFTHVQSCDVDRVQSATEWTASVHSSHMSKAVM